MKYFLIITSILSWCMTIAVANNTPYPCTHFPNVTCHVSQSRTFQKVGHKYYLIGKSKVSWFHSLQLCRRFGGDLVSIESSEEMDALSSYLKSKGHEGNDGFWTSGNDFVVNHKFVSATSGMPLPFTSWSDGQPDLPGVEHCMDLRLVGGEFRMNNWECSEDEYFICERQNANSCPEEVNICVSLKGNTYSTLTINC